MLQSKTEQVSSRHLIITFLRRVVWCYTPMKDFTRNRNLFNYHSFMSWTQLCLSSTVHVHTHTKKASPILTIWTSSRSHFHPVGSGHKFKVVHILYKIWFLSTMTNHVMSIWGVTSYSLVDKYHQSGRTCLRNHSASHPRWLWSEYRLLIVFLILHNNGSDYYNYGIVLHPRKI